MIKNENSPQSPGRRDFIAKTAALSTFFIVPRFVLGGKGYRAPSDILNVGFIGAGRQALGLQRNFLNTGEMQILAVADVYKAKVENFANQVQAFYAAKSQTGAKSCDRYNDFREILGRKDVDAVVIATPDHWHSNHAILAAKAGKDIYCEKPLSLTIKEGRAMVTAARKNNRVFQTGSMQRSFPEFRQAVELVRNGLIGDLQNIKVSVGGPPVPYNLPAQPMVEGLDWNFWLGPNEPVAFNTLLTPSITDTFWAKWRDFKGLGGGFMTDWGAHMFDIAQWAMDMDGSGPEDVIPPDGKDYAFLTYKYANGVVMTHENFGKPNGVQFNGTKGRIEVQRGKLFTDPAPLQTMAIPETGKHVYKSENHYKDWLQAVRNRSKPICDVEIGHRTATVCNIGNIAYELKRPLKWNPATESFLKDDEANALRGRKMRKEWNVL